MLKIALINSPQFTRYPQPPMGLATIAAVLEKEGHRVTIIDASALRLNPENLSSMVTDADVVGFTATTPNVSIAINAASHLKRTNPRLTIILGGAHATLLPEETLAKAPEIDIIVRGEGEETSVELLRALESKRPLETIAGISYRIDDRIVSNENRSSTVDIDSLPFLAYHLLPLKKYRPYPPHGRRFPYAAIITSRGCPYHCAYCSKPIFGNNFRAQSPERVIAEIAYLKERFGVNELAFYDDVFTLNKQRAYAIAEGMIEKGLILPWTCETRVNLVDRELLLLMKQAGCYAISYGIESASEEIRNMLHKDITQEQIERAVRLTHEAGIHAIGYLMIGSPGETSQTIISTVELTKKLKLDFAQFAITIPFPSTELYKLYLQEGHDSIPWESLIYYATDNPTTPVFESSHLSRRDLSYWARRAQRDFYLRPSYIWQRIRSIKSLRDLKVNLNGFLILLKSINPLAGK